jgi:hypothetical protein
MPYIIAWLQAFLWTLGSELCVAGTVLRRELPLSRRLSVITIANVATHPAVWLIFPELGAGYGWPRWLSLGLSEVWAYGFEIFVYATFLGKGRLRQALVASVLANTASFALGYVLRPLGWL